MKKTSLRHLSAAVFFSLFVISLLPLGTDALTPLQDTRPEFFAGEWIGLGPSNTFCRLSLDKAGRGSMRLRYKSSRIVDIKIEKWENQSQNLRVVTSSVPIEVRNQSNGTFVIVMTGAECQMARADAFNSFLKNQPD